jgi:hypothetical protein
MIRFYGYTIRCIFKSSCVSKNLIFKIIGGDVFSIWFCQILIIG